MQQIIQRVLKMIAHVLCVYMQKLNSVIANHGLQLLHEEEEGGSERRDDHHCGAREDTGASDRFCQIPQSALTTSDLTSCYRGRRGVEGSSNIGRFCAKFCLYVKIMYIKQSLNELSLPNVSAHFLANFESAFLVDFAYSYIFFVYFYLCPVWLAGVVRTLV